MRRHSIELGLLGVAAGVAVIAAMLALHGTGTEAWQLATRYTARTSFFVFMAVYLVGPVARLWRPGFIAAALRQRRGLGLAFTGAHFVHLGALTTFFSFGTASPATQTVVFGGLAFAFIAAMAATSNDWSVRTLGPRVWGRLHRIGLHYVWLIFAFTLLGRALHPRIRDFDSAVDRLMFVLALGALAFRAAVSLAARARAPVAERAG
jgi:sulfoxide reductase heme-binding subunit YedZ